MIYHSPEFVNVRVENPKINAYVLLEIVYSANHNEKCYRLLDKISDIILSD